MKKIYMKPALQMEQMDNQNIICASDPKVSINTTEGPIDAGSVESRRNFNTWDDEEEE